MSNLAIFFGGALLGAGVTFLSMCFAYCAGQAEHEEDKGDEDVQ